MKKNITRSQMTKLWKAKGSRAALAARLEVTEMSIRGWENGKPDVNKSLIRFEVARLLEEHGIN